jgi:hypothetical protein
MRDARIGRACRGYRPRPGEKWRVRAAEFAAGHACSKRDFRSGQGDAATGIAKGGWQVF